MKIALINGSPRTYVGHAFPSASLELITMLKTVLRRLRVYDTEEFHVKAGKLSGEDRERILHCDVWLLSFPVYSAGIPSHMLELMRDLEEGVKKKYRRKEGPILYEDRIRVYAMVNGALFEGIGMRSVFTSLELWCEESGLLWGSGLALGGAAALQDTGLRFFSFRTWRTLNRAMLSFGMAMQKEISAGDFFCSPNISRARYVKSVAGYSRRKRKEWAEKPERIQ